MASDRDPPTKKQQTQSDLPSTKSLFDATVASEDGERLIETPDWIGRYRIVRRIGSGGFGSVFQGKDESLNRDVAIKVPIRLLDDASDEYQWTSEARMVAQLDHPNIVPVYDIGQSKALPFYVVSRYIEGADLCERMQASKPALDETVRWVTEIADALHHAHQQGLVHRDVKPSNILIDQQNRAWLTDFGLAISDDVPRPVRGGRLIGTYSYMSPEQARGEGHLVDGRADLFALGIVLYELLVGRRPFEGGSSRQLLQNIMHAAPKRLCQVNPEVPLELERICLKALALRVSDRYVDGLAMANDLRGFQMLGSTADASVDLSGEFLPSSGSGSRRSSGMSATATRANAPRGEGEPRVVPKGLRAFDRHDQDFFLQLVPGARDARGVPEVLRQLKIRVDSRESQDTFRVGLIYGPSGSGKSSLMHAGLVPLLSRSVEVVSVEANAKHTESRILSELQKLDSSVAQQTTLIGAMAQIRKNSVSGGKKVLLVIDQFEQWLHAHPTIRDEVLLDAIRQCDGKNLQCLLLIRDDFWMPATQFFHELDLRLVQDFNCVAVDRFDVKHAEFVLKEFGRAYGCLPENLDGMTEEQRKFVQQIVRGVQENGKVISIHLAVLAQMLKGQQWDLKTLAEFGGAEGVDTGYLRMTFEGIHAPPHHRRFREPAKAVLAALLPERAANIKGQMVASDQLQRIAGLDDETFDEFVEMMDGELRLITPTAATESSDSDITNRSYQLTHDFLVQPIRQWLTEMDQQTVRGRTKLRLAELTEYWKRNRDNRFLPSGLEYLRFLALTDSGQRSDEQQQLMAAASKHHGTRWAIAVLMMLMLGVTAGILSQSVRRRLADQQTDSNVARLLTADIAMIPDAINSIADLNEDPPQQLIDLLQEQDVSDRQKFAARLALVQSDPGQVVPLIEMIPQFNPDGLSLIAERLKPHQTIATPELWSRFESSRSDETNQLRFAWVLAQLDAASGKWQRHASTVVRSIVNQNPTQVGEFIPGLVPIAKVLIEPASRYFAESGLADNSAAESSDIINRDTRLNAAFLLSKCIGPEDAVLAELLAVAVDDEFELLMSVAERDPDAVASRLREELRQHAEPEWSDEQELSEFSSPDAALVQRVQAFGGLVTNTFALIQKCPLAKFLAVAESLSEFGYRPECVRVYESSTDPWVASVLVRDGLDWEFTFPADRNEVGELQTQMRSRGMYPCDVTAIPANAVGMAAGGEAMDADDVPTGQRYGVLWTRLPSGTLDAKIYVGLNESEHQPKGWGPLLSGGFVPKANLKQRDSKGTDHYSSVRFRMVASPITDDTWNDSPFSFRSRNVVGKYQTDVRLNPPGEFDEESVSYSAIWWNGGDFESKTLTQLPIDEHLAKANELSADNYRAVSLSVVQDGDQLVAASVWHRPVVTDTQKDHVASRQANAIIALARLGVVQPLWEALQLEPDPRLRSFLVDRMARLEMPVQTLLARLEDEQDESTKFAVLAAISKYRPDQLSNSQLRGLRELTTNWGTTDPRASIHAICRYLANRWGWGETVAAIDDAESPNGSSTIDSAKVGSDGSPGWIRNGQGQTLVTISGPVSFQMGSPAHEAFRDHGLEAPVQAKIPRSFAIADSEVTLEQYQRFDPEADYATQYALHPDCPMTSVRWFHAIKYCRWLSEQEGVPESQMCYPSIEEIERDFDSPDGIRRPKDFLKRTGYRLPTEAEWEYACRGGTTTPRSFGHSPELLSQYAWTTENSARNSQVLFHPVKQLMPNPFGLFDTLGNVMEWCETHDFSLRGKQTTMVDSELGLLDTRSIDRVARGSAVFYVPTTMRSAKREQEKVYTTHPYLGFRIARTIRSESDANDESTATVIETN
ncbi:bifunctional serine/threonine-protein kinase/formylglycine-generating enzyme family protein [Rhodopirellula halodulae]|uniref:bifunctional serine/threonine-protein kinase/formylglycine-generating enzyme family protein n=1 Tax=Rhodopirellula halodulae TaxID=2894198 RepID=UPI001E313845|nr:bifunctional serine/threonine-protein kinase/formylglycine-generating enzyme family protein [Rhodopirellula sp. JC737]MCC9658448.1 SUMF1/EgtB/PvdO family nonheme iron enzyme [Rhodopirellula sp. JC737]